MLCSSSVSAQQVNGAIKGNVVDTKGIAVPMGAVYLLKANDSSLVKTSLINGQGAFEFDHLKPGPYLVNISVLGYRRYILPIINIQQNAIDVGAITITKGNDLKQVDITAKTANYIDVKPGKIILNVNKSILSAGNTALDILNTAPGVLVDDNGNVKLRGKDVTVMMNNKQVYLSPDALAELLRNTPGNTIAQIELISNPNATYSAEGSGGVINIKIQRDKTDGIKGSVNAAFGITDINEQYGTRKKWSTGFNLDYNNKNISLFGGFTRATNISQRLSVTDRDVYNPSLKQAHTDYLNDLNDRGNIFRLGMDYAINPKQLVGFLVNGIYSNYDYTKNTSTVTTVYSKPDSMFVSNSLTTRKLLTYTLNLNYKGSLGKWGELSADADYSVFDRKPFETVYTDRYVLHPVIILQRSPQPPYIQNTFPTIYNIYSFNVSDNIKLNKLSSVLATAKVSYVTNANNADFGYVTNNVYKSDPRFTNQYNYNEQINALGITYSAILNRKTSIEVGLRAEQTINHGQATSLTKTSPVATNNYVNLFPAFQLISNLNDNDQLSFSYSRRIRRPMYTDLNPFLNYQDQYNYYIGNPELKPQYTSNVEITNTFKQKFSVTLSTSITRNYVFVTFLPGNIIAQKVNFGYNNSYGVQINQAVDVAKWWKANLNADISYEHYDNSLNGTDYNINTQEVNLNIQQQFSFLKQFKAELLTTYESPKYEGFYHYNGRYRVNAGLSKSIFNKMGSVQFQVSDVFNSYYNTYYADYQGLNYTAYARNFFRTYQLSMVYSFGSKGAKEERKHRAAALEEQGRAGGGN
ncbi:TonB-dependent receptor family protein [Mucilaginibacter sp. HMF5004]|uniref:outer membrane beta-barrel family protein n=1 Tax=Mucilaginibacter rivuli TaxID=2857527 RepID=UPI001C5E964D|nr:outer membrane beta-barrel family protein [Mucilaginibacter rivuli]MBW4891344.1 TonB-dependent receptor family protein [Mucilaginibacter rivuli]